MDHDGDDHDRPTTSGPETTPSTAAPITNAAPTTTEQDSPNTQSSSTEYLTYGFEGIATIHIALHDGHRLEFWSVIAEPGWVFRVDDDEASKVKIKFQPKAGGDEAEFEVTSKNGRIEVKRES